MSVKIEQVFQSNTGICNIPSNDFIYNFVRIPYKMTIHILDISKVPLLTFTL